MATGTLNIGTPSSTSTTYATTGYYVDGTKVVGAQGAAISFTAATTNVTSEITNISNAIVAIVARLNAHGLIA